MEWMEIVNEIVSGGTVALLMIPEAIAFSLWIGMMPKEGIKGSIVMSGITSLLGGQPGLISGTAGSTLSTIKNVVKKYGNEYVFVTVIIAGILQLLFGFAGIYKLLDRIPKSVLSGFLIGLAWLIFQGQFIHLKEANLEKFESKDDEKKKKEEAWLPKKMVLATIGTTLLELIAMIVISNSGIPYTRTFAPIITITLMTIITYIFPKIPVQNIAARGIIKGALPKFRIPQIEWSFMNIIKLIPYALGMTITGLLESMIMVKEVGLLIHRTGNAFQETLAQGVANIASGTTGGLGGCVLAGQSLMNTLNGSRTRLSSIVACISLLLIAIFFTGALQFISMPSIIAIMIYIAGQTALAGGIKDLYRTVDKDWIVTILTILVVVITHNLTIGTIVGTIISYGLHNKLTP